MIIGRNLGFASQYLQHRPERHRTTYQFIDGQNVVLSWGSLTWVVFALECQIEKHNVLTYNRISHSMIEAIQSL